MANIFDSEGKKLVSKPAPENSSILAVTLLDQNGDPVNPSGGPVTTTYAKRTDIVNDNLIYKGQAQVGSQPSDNVWQIRKITISPSGEIVEQWADGNGFYDNVWDNRATLTYT